MNEGAREANRDRYQRGIERRLDEIIELLKKMVPFEDAPSEFCECEHPLPATRTTIGVCIICDGQTASETGEKP